MVLFLLPGVVWSQAVQVPELKTGIETQTFELLEEHLIHTAGEHGVITKIDFDESMLKDMLIVDPDIEYRPSGHLDPRFNFNIYSQGIPAGDILGDGKRAILHATGFARDDRTADLEDATGKSAIFYGGNFTQTPDELHYTFLRPAGDLNGNGHDDMLARISGGTYEVWHGSPDGLVPSGQNLFFPYGTTISFVDLDGDGYDDIIGYVPNFSGLFSVAVLWGGEDMHEQEFVEYNLNMPGVRAAVAAGNVGGQEHDDLVVFVTEVFENDAVLDVAWVSFDQNRNLVFNQQFSSAHELEQPITNNSAAMADFNGDGHTEILFSASVARGSRYLFTFDPQAEEFNRDPLLFHEGERAKPLGDLNNNGRIDFLLGDADNDYKPWIAWGPADLSDGLSFDYELPGHTSGDFTWSSSYSRFGNWFGDLTGNGADDFIINHFSTDGHSMGRRYILGQDDATPESEFVLFDRTDFQNLVASVSNVGDFTGDGNDDLAIVYNSKRQIKVYPGAQGLDGTAHVIDLPFFPLAVSGADVNGNGYNDLLVSGGNGRAFVILFGGSSPSTQPDLIITCDDFRPDAACTYLFPQPVGDVNGNGYTDFVATSYTTRGPDGPLNELYLFFGGETISTVPDVVIEAAPEVTNFTYIGQNNAVVSLGDINGNGFDDFAVGAFQKNQGEVQIYYGNEAGEFTGPDLVIESDSELQQQWFGESLAVGHFTCTNQIQLAVGVGFSVLGHHIQIFNVASDTPTEPVALLRAHASTGIGWSSNQEWIVQLQPIISRIKTTPDIDGSGLNGLIRSSNRTNAVVYTGADMAAGITENRMLLRAPNQGTYLGGIYDFAVGTLPNGKIGAIMAQTYDNNDAMSSSRVYGYELPAPLYIADVQDVPDDQGYWVSVHVGGYFMEAQSEGFQMMDGWAVWLNGELGWENKQTIFYMDGAAPKVDVRLPSTMPTGMGPDDAPEHVYELIVSVHAQNGVVQSAPMLAWAYDNLAPAQVTGLSAIYDAGTVTMNWSAVPDHDLAAYHVWQVNDEGRLVDDNGPLAVTASTHIELTDLSGIAYDRFAVSAVDVHRNEGLASEPVSSGMPTSAGDLVDLPVAFDLKQNYPNPFNPATQIRYDLPEQAHVTLEVFTVQGQRVATLVNGVHQAGRHSVVFEAGSLSSGIYLYRLQAGSFVKTEKMMLVK